MDITLRLETSADYHETEDLTREAFWDLFRPGCVEHWLLHQLRQSPAFIPELDYVACDGNRIVGNIVYSKAVVRDGAEEHPVLCMGPLSVLPAYQKQGVGSRLMETTLKKARALGHAAVVIYGHPDYYHRFGFRDAREYNIQTPDGQNFDAFMALALNPLAVQTVRGRFYEDAAFHVDEQAVEEFDRRFSPKDKHKRAGQFE